MILFFADVLYAVHLRLFSTNCSEGTSYLTFRFGIIHCHYYCSLSNVLSSCISLYNLLYLLHCVRLTMKTRASLRETVRRSEGFRYTRILMNFRLAVLREFAPVLADFAFHALFLMYFICISHLSTKEEGFECRIPDDEPLNHSTVILHVGLQTHCSVIAQKT